MKKLISNSTQEFLKILGLDYKFIELKPTENVDLLIRKFQMDCLIECEKDGKQVMVIVEFQSTPITPDKKLSILSYINLTLKKYKKDVITVVVNTEKTEDMNILKNVCTSALIYYKNTSIPSIKESDTFNIIENKILNNEKLNKMEILRMKLIPYSENEEDLQEIFKKSCQLTNNITDENIRLELKEIQIYYCLGDYYIKEEKEREEILMIIKKEDSSLYHLGLIDGRKEKIEESKLYQQGEKNGIEKVAINLKKQGMKLEDIKKATGLTIKQINNL